MAEDLFSPAAGLRPPSPPRPSATTSAAGMGVRALRDNPADAAIMQDPLLRLAPLLEPRPRLEQPSQMSGVYYNPTTDQFSVGGQQFGSRDYDVALQSANLVGRPAPAPTGEGWERISPTDYQQYLSSISEGRGFFGNIGMGFRDVGQGLVGGAGRGLQMLGAEDVGGALVGAGEAIGPSAADQARDAAIAEQQGLFGKIGTAAVRSIPTLGLSVLGGVGAAGLAVRAGAAAGSLTARGAALGGVATTILPMELQSSWQAAEQGGYDTADPAVRDDILYTALTKTAGQTLAPAFIAGGFSPALRRVVSESAQRTMGSRIARGVGAGALEGSAETFAQIADRVMFDPELRAEFNQADWAALASLIVNKYGEEALVALGAGFLLGGSFGALGTPTQAAPAPTDVPPPRRDVDSGQPVDALSGATLEPQALPAPAPVAGLLPPPPAALPAPPAALPAPPAGLLPAPPAALAAPDRSAAAAPDVIVPPAPAGSVPPPAPAAPVTPTPPTAADLGLEGSVAEGFDIASRRQGPPAPPAPPAPPIRSAAPSSPTTETAIGAQLNRLMAQARARQEAEAAARAAQEAQAAQEAAQRTQRENQLIRSQRGQRAALADAATLGDLILGERFDSLTDAAKTKWLDGVRALDPNVRAELAALLQVTGLDPTVFVEAVKNPAVRQGYTALNTLAGEVRSRVSPKRRRQAAEPPTIIAPEAAPSALPEGVFGTANGQPFKNKAAAQLQRKRVASRENIQVDRLEPVEVPGGWGLRAREETPPTPPKGGRPKKGAPRAVQEPSPAPRAVRQRPKAGPRVRGEDTQGQEAAGARVEEVQDAEVQVVEGRGGRRELEPVAPAGAEVTAELDAPQTAQQRVAAEDLAEVDALIESVETSSDDAEVIEQLSALVGWAEIKTQSSKAAMERAQSFLNQLESDPATAKQLNRARVKMRLGEDISKAHSDIEKARKDVVGGKKGAEKRLSEAETRLEKLQDEARNIGGAFDSNVDKITAVIEAVNAGGSVSLSDRSNLIGWWSKVKGSDPQYNGRPLADYITGGPDFFNYGPRVNGHRQVVAKGTGRTSRTTFNFVGGAFNNLDGSSIGRALPHGKAKMVISAFRSKLKRAPSIKTFTSVAQLKRKDPALYARAAAARPQGDFDNVTAAGYSFGDGEVLIFTDNVANEAHLRFVLAHETMGHYGLRGFIPAAEFDKTMESIYDNFPHIQGPVDAAMARVEGLSKAEAVEEYLSDYAALLENNLILRVWNAVKNALNSLGLKFADDYARYLVNHARQYARRPGVGHFADMDIIARRANGVETGAIAPGRYKRSDDVFGTLERTMSTARLMFGDRPLPKKAKAKVTIDIPNNMESFKNEFLSLFQFQQRKNPGLKRLGDIVQAGVDNSLYIRNILNEVMAPALNLAVRIPGTNIRFGGRTTEEVKLTNDALAVTRIRAAQRLRDDPKLSQSKTPIFRFNETTGEFEETGEAERLDSLTRLTLDEFRTGFTAELKRDTGEVQKFVFDGDPTATEKSGSWIAYNALRDGLLEAEKRLLRAKLQANTTTIDAALEEIASLTPTNRLDAEQRRLIRTAARLYSDLYRKGAGINPQTGEIQADAGAITKAEEFLAAFNTAIIADKPASVDTDLTNKDSAASRNKTLAEIIQREASKQEADDIVASIEKFKDVVRRDGRNPLQQDKFFIQQKIASLNAAQFVADNGEQSFRTTIVGQYTPITQEGKYQGRVVPVDATTGEPVALGDTYGGSMGYTQFETQSEADAFAESFRALMVDDNGDPLIFDMDLKGPAGETIPGKVRFEMRVDEVETEVTAPLQLNLNEFMLGVARYSIPLKPSKMEEILTDLTRQDDRARKRLLTEFTAGDPRDGTKNIAAHVDGRASTISKTLMRPEIERLMSRRNKRSRELWDGDPRRVEVTRTRYEQLMADPGASREQVDAARRDYEEAQMLFNETGGQANKFKNQAGKLLAFMNNNERLTESNFDSNEYIARWRNLTAIFQLGASLATAALNPVSVYTNAAPYLATRNAKTAFGGGFGMGRTLYEINRAFKQVGLPGTLPNKASAKYNEAVFWESVSNDKALQEQYGVTGFEARMLAQEIRQGSMQPALTNTLSQTARGMATTGVGQKTVDGMMFMFNVSEQASRRAAGLAAFRMEFARRTNAIDPDMKPGTPEYEAAVEQAYRDSIKFVSEMLRLALGEYSVINRPNFFRSGIAGMLYMYKVFPTTSIQLFNNMDMKGKAWMLLGLWMLGGVAAFPFAEDIEDLLDTLEQKFGIGFGSPSVRATLAAELEAIQPGLARWVLSGVGGQLLPFDVASRVALSPIPATEFFLAGTDRGRMYEEILGPMPSAAMGATQFVVDAVRAPFSTTITAEDVSREAPVTFLRLLADTYAYLNSGAIVDRRGYVVSPDVQWYDIAARLAGFYPSSAAQEYSTIRIVNRIANYRREMSAQFRSEWVQARIRNDRDRMREVEEAVRDWNETHRGTPLQIDNFRQGAQRAYREAIRPATARTLRTTPQAGRNEFETIMESLTR